MTRVLITGGAGFIGSHLTSACLRLGWDVSIIYQPETGLGQISDILEQVTTYPACAKTAEVIHVMQQAQPDLVFHLASIFVAEHTSDYILNLVQSNITFGAQILEAMTQCQVRYLVNTGTSWQNFENQEYNPVNLYAATKQAFEDILIYYIQAAAIGAITLRLFDTYGPDDPRPKLFSALQKSARTKTPLEMSPGDQLIDLVHVEDVAEAYLVAARRLLDGKGKGHEVYAVSSAKPVRLRDLVAIYQRLTGCSFEVNWGRRPYREREVMLPWSKGKRLPEWKPRISLEQGISSLGVPHHFQS